MTPPLTLRPAALDDAALLLGWRNEPGTRAQSFDTAIIEAPEHGRWLAARLRSMDTRIYIAEVGQRPIGQARVDRRSPHVGEISVAVDAGSRGQGFGRVIIAEASFRAAVELDLKQIEARIKTSNDASLRAFRAAGYASTRAPVTTPDNVSILVWWSPHVRPEPSASVRSS